MSIAVVLPCNMYAAPFFRRYEKILTANKIEFDLIYWNRALIEEKVKGKLIPYNEKDEVLSGKKTKVLKYIGFSNFVKRRLASGKYEKIIFLGSYSGIMAILSLYLRKHYKGKYWLDIRDYTFEQYLPYYKAMEIAINSSYRTVISSEKFMSFLPKYDYLIAHNIDKDNIENTKKAMTEQNHDRAVRISYIGQIGFYEENKKLLNALKNDSRFVLQYYGVRSETLQEYCQAEGIGNVDFRGRFEPEETAQFYGKTDIINNVYGNDNLLVKTALSNKLYFAAGLKLPILVSAGTYMYEITDKYGFGFAVDFNDPQFPSKLYSWYQEFVRMEDYTCFDDFWRKVQAEDNVFISELLTFLSDITAREVV